MGNTVEISSARGVGYLTLNRPEAMNAINLTLAQELAAGLEEFETNDQIRAVVLRAEGRGFCAGGDLQAMVEGPGPAAVLKELVFHFHRAILGLRRLRKPVLAEINGAAAGAGMSLALACDLRYASPNARFRQAYTSNGLVPDGGWTVWLTALLGLARASELVFLDPVLDAEQALALGLVHRMVPAEEIREVVRQEAERLACGATFAYGQAKELLNRVALPTLETQLELERQAMVAAAAGEDGTEGIRAFLAKRRPQFKGR